MKRPNEPKRATLTATAALVPVSDAEALKEAGVPFSSDLLRKWYHVGRNAEIFCKISRRLFVDLASWRALVERERAANAKRAAKFAALRGDEAAV